MVQTQFQVQIKIFRSDNGREYFNQILEKKFSHKGIIHQSSCTDTPQQNGVAERKNKHLLEVARALLFTTNVPKNLWGEAVLMATHLINRMPSQVLDFKSPLHVLQNFFPNSKITSSLLLKIFGCTVYSQY